MRVKRANNKAFRVTEMLLAVIVDKLQLSTCTTTYVDLCEMSCSCGNILRRWLKFNKLFFFCAKVHASQCLISGAWCAMAWKFWLQVAIQLAYWQLHGEFTKTYEPASHRSVSPSLCHCYNHGLPPVYACRQNVGDTKNVGDSCWRHIAKSLRQTFFDGRPVTASVTEVIHTHQPIAHGWYQIILLGDKGTCV